MCESEGRFRQRREGEVLMNGLMAHWPTNVAVVLPVALTGLVKHTHTHTHSQWHMQINTHFFFSADLYCLTKQKRAFIEWAGLFYTWCAFLFLVLGRFWVNINQTLLKLLPVVKVIREEEVMPSWQSHIWVNNLCSHSVSRPSVKYIFGLEHLMGFKK